MTTSIAQLAFAILAIASLPGGHPIASFRNHELGPEGRATELATYFVDAARESHIDVFTLTAIAWSETNFDSSRVGKIGERSIMQLHPRTAAGRLYIRAMRRGWPRADLDVLAINLGSDAYRHGLEVCGFNRPRYALGFYRSGRCVAGPAVQRVMVARYKLLKASGAVL